MSISKEQIEEKVSHKAILDHFLRPYYGNLQIKEGVLISNPLLARKQQTPSFNIYYRDGKWAWKDFTGMKGSAFDLVMNMYGVTFDEACDIINQEMSLNLESDYYKQVKPIYIPKPEPEIPCDKNYNYELSFIEWDEKLLSFWEQYGIKEEGLDKYKVKPLKSVFAYNKSNNPYLIEASEFEPMFGYIREGWAKIYRPYSRPMRFLYVGAKPEDYVFGLEQLPLKGKNLYLVGGEKDVITMYAHGMSAVCLNSEESSPINYPDLLKLIRDLRFENYYVMLDNDKTGIRRMEEISKEFPIFKVKKVPEMEYGKDISDYYKNKYNEK